MNELQDIVNVIKAIPNVIVTGLLVVAVLSIASAWWREKGHRDWN